MRCRMIGFTILLAGLCSCPQTMKVPEFYYHPHLKAQGPVIGVKVQVAPFQIVISGEAKLEKLDEHRVRLSSRSGHLQIALQKDEAIYGLTERIVASRKKSERYVMAVGGLDRRGEEVPIWIRPSEALYVPFYISSTGYGMVVEGSGPGVFDVGKSHPDLLELGWEPGPQGFSCVFIAGPGYAEIMDRYTGLTGRPILPPKWVFRPWKWRDEHRKGPVAELDGVAMNADLVDDIVHYDQLGFPVGVYLIDRPWAEGTYGYGNFNWDQVRFPNPDQMIQALHDRGWKVIVWGGPWALGKEPGEFGPEARAKRLIIGDRNLDYTNPEAVAWHKEKIEAFLKSSGVDGWKLDRGDEYNPSHKSDIYSDGRSGFAVHNDYVRLYVKTYYEASKEALGDDFVLMSRPAYTGTTSISIVFFGDVPGAYFFGWPPTDRGLRSVIIALQRAAFLGYPVWGSDTGGYQGFKQRDVFGRWLELSCFCPLMEIGGVGPHEPWAMPTQPAYDEEMIKIYRRYTTLHDRLADYTYELAKRAHETGDPIVHPLVFDWPDDPKVKNMWDEYLYGPSLLIAPIWKNGSREREVYLPRGEWKDLWDASKTFTGPTTIQPSVPLDRIAVYVREDKENLLPKGLIEGL